MNGTTTAQLAEKTAKAVTGSVEEWTGFLQSAARLYKYSYPEQLLIYAQRPDATACASYEIWNQTMRRYVRRGARGIALPDGAGAVRYVFDVADTGARKSSREVKTWALDENNREAVAHALETQYGSAAKLGIAGQLEEIAMQQSMDYWQWHQDELRGIVDGSFLEGYDELNLEIAFRNTAAASVKYMLLSRCNLAREYQIEPEELAGVLEWNTSAASGALGSAVSELSEGVLRQIERTIRQYERSQNYDERTDVYEERRVLDSRSDSSRTVGDTEQIRTDAGMVSEGASDDHLQQPAPEREADRAPEGTGYRARTRFAKFYNLPELMNMFREVADIKTADQLHLPTPNAHYETVVVQPSEIQKRMVQELSKRAAKIHGGAVDPHIDNMLKVSMDGKKLGLDQRLINPMLPDDPGSKVNACVGNVMRIYREGSEQKLTQLIFSDMSTPKNGQEKEFSVYDDIREKLLAQGVPESEIAFIHNADTEAKKKELFAKVRTGQVRILLGSTAKMGAGTNVQDRLIASHDLDCPWRPGDLEQRAGRIVRQGNRNADVYVYRYVTDGTFDAYSWQTIENKQKFISQVMTSKSPVRVCDDVDESVLSYAEIKALCAGDARIREKMDLDVEVSRLKLMQADYQSKKYRLEDRLLRYFPQEIQNKTERIEGHVQDIACLQAHVLPEDGFQMEVGGKMYTEKEAAGQALIECCKKWKGDVIQDAVTYRGMSASLAFDAGSRTYWLNMHGNMTYSVELGNDPRGNITRIDNRLARVPDNLEKARMELQGLKQQEKAAKEELEKPFAQEAELVEKRMRLAQLNSELNIDDKAQIEAAIEDAQDVPSIREQLRVPCEKGKNKIMQNQEER